MPEPITGHHTLIREFEETEIDRVADELIQFAGDSIKIWLFEGTLGAGKTRLVKALCKVWGVKEEVTSPSFPLVNQYATASGDTIYHLDLYRLKSLEQAAEIGLFEMAESGYVCLIEWASAVGYQPATQHIALNMEYLSETTRRVSVQAYEN